MCQILKVEKFENPKEVIAYKVFKSVGNFIYAEFYGRRYKHKGKNKARLSKYKFLYGNENLGDCEIMAFDSLEGARNWASISNSYPFNLIAEVKGMATMKVQYDLLDSKLNYFEGYGLTEFEIVKFVER